MDQVPTWVIIIGILVFACAITGVVGLVTACFICANKPLDPTTSRQPQRASTSTPSSDITFIDEPLLPSHPSNPNGGANPLSARSSGSRNR